MENDVLQGLAAPEKLDPQPHPQSRSKLARTTRQMCLEMDCRSIYTNQS